MMGPASPRLPWLGPTESRGSEGGQQAPLCEMEVALAPCSLGVAGRRPSPALAHGWHSMNVMIALMLFCVSSPKAVRVMCEVPGFTVKEPELVYMKL